MRKLNNKLIRQFEDKEYAHAYMDEFLNASIATQIKVLREQRDWNQEHLASLAGMKQSRISLLENVNYDMWSISTLKKLAEAFDLALNVSFEGFSKRIDDINNLSREVLERPSRMEDLTSALKESMKEKNLDSTNQALFYMSVLTSEVDNIIKTCEIKLSENKTTSETETSSNVYPLKKAELKNAVGF